MKFLYLILFSVFSFSAFAQPVDETKFTVIDSFKAGKYRVVAAKYHALEGDFAKRYHFLAQEKQGMAPKAVSLGSYSGINNYLRETGKLKEGERVFHLDGYDGKKHYTFAIADKEPPYEAVKAKVIELLSKDDFAADATSSSDFRGGVLP